VPVPGDVTTGVPNNAVCAVPDPSDIVDAVPSVSDSTFNRLDPSTQNLRFVVPPLSAARSSVAFVIVPPNVTVCAVVEFSSTITVSPDNAVPVS